MTDVNGDFLAEIIFDSEADGHTTTSTGFSLDLEFATMFFGATNNLHLVTDTPGSLSLSVDTPGSLTLVPDTPGSL